MNKKVGYSSLACLEAQQGTFPIAKVQNGHAFDRGENFSMTGDEVRQLFLQFFENKGHTIIPSSSLIPHGDPTLLLTTAGMVQVKPYFLGLAPPPTPRLASCQKCFRTTDIEAVGDTKHLTFFEMLGNFSVGDYFKKEAIAWAWEFLTQWLTIKPARLWITIYFDDEESFNYWREIGVPAKRIVRFGEEDNFWGPAGDSGPCGPCSEIHYDYGKEFACGRPDCGPNCDCPRFVEIWNLVFTQYNQDKDGKRYPLPKPHIDTGMGLERTVAMMQGKTSVFEIDLFTPIVAKVCEFAGRQYGEDEEYSRAIRVVAEHTRASVFLIADGVLPGNEGRGYVLRRILRRAVLFARRLGINLDKLGDIGDAAIRAMRHTYPELGNNQKRILEVIGQEATKFNDTIIIGTALLDKFIEETKRDGSECIPGDRVFMLHDTYGFPKEIAAEIACEHWLSIDWKGFEISMTQQRERARTAGKFGVGDESDPEICSELGLPATRFFGYDEFSRETKTIALIVDGESVPAASQGQEIQIVLEESPFYGAMGGQIGDRGEIRGPNGKAEVTNTIRHANVIVHQATITEGSLSVSEVVVAKVDQDRRLDIARNHTSTHLLQAALREVLGEHVHQAGSLVEPERLRFDFAHGSGLSTEEIARIEQIVNRGIRGNLPVTCENMPYTQAVSEGAIALFGEKYHDEVRVVRIGEPVVSRELCGGTHVSSTGEIGFIRITMETSIGYGTRRIEAVTGRGAEKFVSNRLSILDAVAEQLQAPSQQIHDKVLVLLSDLENAHKRVQSVERELARKAGRSLLDKVESIDGTNTLIARVPEMSPESLRSLGDELKSKLGSGVFLLGTIYQDKPCFLAMVTSDITAKGLRAGEIVKQVAKIAGGGGGGKPDLGQGSGKDKTKLDEALKWGKDFITKGRTL